MTADIRNGEGVTDEPEPEIYVVAPRDGGAPTVGPSPAARWSSGAPHDGAVPPTRTPSFGRSPPTSIRGCPSPSRRLDEQVARLTARPRFIAWLLTAFAALALLLAAAGLYSVASYLVTQRRRDIGVRMAIGASPRDVARQVVGEAGRWIIGGALVGSALGWMGTRALQSQLYQVEALDPWSWTGALLALALVLVMAVFRPAYRAAHVDPVAALRAD